jgi:hypothetical protein
MTGSAGVQEIQVLDTRALEAQVEEAHFLDFAGLRAWSPGQRSASHLSPVGSLTHGRLASKTGRV